MQQNTQGNPSIKKTKTILAGKPPYARTPPNPPEKWKVRWKCQFHLPQESTLYNKTAKAISQMKTQKVTYTRKHPMQKKTTWDNLLDESAKSNSLYAIKHPRPPVKWKHQT